MDVVAESILKVNEQRDQARGLKMVYEPKPEFPFWLPTTSHNNIRNDLLRKRKSL
jgi:hypothetical protein